MSERDLFVLRKRGTIVIDVRDRELTEVTIPDGVVKLREGAFKACKNLKEAHLPTTVKEIGDAVFRGCTSLQSINLENVQSIGNNAFNGCESLLSIKFSDYLDEIKDHAFENCSSLESVVLPTGLLSIGVKAFAGCTSLKKITIPKYLDTIKRNAFSGCIALDSFEVDSDNQTFTSLNGILFTKDSKTIVKVPEGKVLKNDDIPEGADFAEWGPFNETTIYNGICVLGKDMQYVDRQFANNQEIVKLVVPQQVKGINSGAFKNCKNLHEIIFTEGIDFIEASAFEGCDALERVKLPSSLTYLGAASFAHSINLKQINLPSNLRSLLMNVFDGCVSLTDIDLEISFIAHPDLFDSKSFDGIDRSKCTIHVPERLSYGFSQYEVSVFRGFNIDKKGVAAAAAQKSNK